MSDKNSKKTTEQGKVAIYLVGGGSGGHVSPLRAIALSLEEILGLEHIDITFVCEKGGAFGELMAIPAVAKQRHIMAGKFRRYHGDSFLQHLFDVKTILLNMRDLFKFIVGCFQAFFMLLLHRPDIIFLKGGFVCVPVGWAARLLRIPYVTHDSDAVPGLANRLTAKGAVKNLVALPATNYPYDKEKTIMTGVPIQEGYFDRSEERKVASRQELGLPIDAIVVFVTGGGLGAKKMNESVVKALEVVAKSPDNDIDKSMHIVHITGKKLYESTLDLYDASNLNPDNVTVLDFTTKMLQYTQASDVIISRAGATAIAEFAAAGKPCIIIPGVHLTGGQQVHNANLLENKNAAVVIAQHDVDAIAAALVNIASDDTLRQSLSTAIQQFAIKNSSLKISELLLTIANVTTSRDSE